MRRYHFNVIRNGDAWRDQTGIELATLTEARVQAARLATDLIQEAGEQRPRLNDYEIEVTNERGLTLFCLHVMITDAPVAR